MQRAIANAKPIPDMNDHRHIELINSAEAVRRVCSRFSRQQRSPDGVREDRTSDLAILVKN